MTSILDIYDSLPSDEKEIIGAEILYRIKERKKAACALLLIPENVRKYYDAQFGLGIGSNGGQFKGFSCRACNRWLEFGHKRNCPVDELAGNLDYSAIVQEIDKVRAGGEGALDE